MTTLTQAPPAAPKVPEPDVPVIVATTAVLSPKGDAHDDPLLTWEEYVDGLPHTD